MKRYNGLYEKVYSLENIAKAHMSAKKGKTHYREVQMIESNPEYYFSKIQQMLKEKTFRNSQYKVIYRVMDNGKKRVIMKLPYYPDRIIHHCIVQVCEDFWIRSLITDTFACLKGRGIHRGCKRIKSALQDKKNTQYCLKLDVKQYYPSVDHDTLKGFLRAKIKDTSLLWLLGMVVDSAPGIPIGNYLSQYFGNLYLSSFDHYMKEKMGCKYYYRYCDDIVILNASKQRLHVLKRKASEYLETLHLELNDNWQIFPVKSRGIDFLGYRFFHGYTLMRKSIAQRMKQKVNEIKKNWRRMEPESVVNSIMSYNGWMSHANCKNMFHSFIDDEIFWIVKQKSIQSGKKNPLQGVS